MMQTPFRLALAVVAVALPAFGQAFEGEPPPGSIGWVSVDPRVWGEAPSSPAQAGEVLEAVAVLARLPTEETSGRVLSSLGSVVGAALVGGSPVRATLLEIDAAATGEKIRTGRLLAVVEIQSPEPHAEAIAALRAALGLPAGVSVRRLELPGGLEGFAARDEAWAAGREVSWCSRPESLVVGVGEGALGRWFSPREEREAAWEGHRSAAKVKAGSMAAAVFLDFNELRERAPDALGTGLARRLAEGARLGNARSLLISATRAGTGPIAVEATWSSRAEKPGTFHSAILAHPSWPANWGEPTEPLTMAVSMNLRYYIVLGQSLLRASRDEWGRMEFEAAVSAWVRGHGPELERLTGVLAPAGVVDGSSPGELAARIAVHPEADRAGVARAFTEVMDSLPGHARREGDAWRVTFGRLSFHAAVVPEDQPRMLILATDLLSLERARVSGLPRR